MSITKEKLVARKEQIKKDFDNLPGNVRASFSSSGRLSVVSKDRVAIKKAIKYAYSKKYLIIVVTNQSGIARGYYSEHEIKSLHNEINDELKKKNCKIHDFFYCPYHPKYGNKKYKKL